MSQDENPIRYFDNRLQKEAVKLLPGQYYATASDKALVTILGSCVAACIFDQEKKIGGMNHFMLPDLNFTTNLDHIIPKPSSFELTSRHVSDDRPHSSGGSTEQGSPSCLHAPPSACA